MVVFPNAKINLGLAITNKRADGYHELETCFYPIPWKDVLEIIPSSSTSFQSSGIEIPGEGNIVMSAYEMLKEDYNLPPVAIHLLKQIPIGAGLGGGSADAAFALLLLNDLFNLDIDEQSLINYAVRLGADCAFFIKNRPMLATGIGEKMTVANLNLAGKWICCVFPGLHISTKEAFSGIKPAKPERSISSIIEEEELTSWRGLLKNDFEEHLFEAYPVLASIKGELYQADAEYASMSGSGSTIYGVFESKPNLAFDDSYKVLVDKL